MNNKNVIKLRCFRLWLMIIASSNNVKNNSYFELFLHLQVFAI